jgi:hypothetical protein
MINIKYTNIRVVADKILRDPIFIGLNIETIIDYFVDFITIVGTPELFDEKITEAPIKIVDYRALLPSDFVRENQITINDRPVRAATDTYASFYQNVEANKPADSLIPAGSGEVTYKIKGDYIYLSAKTGSIMMSYKCIATETDESSDDYGYPLLPDDPVFILALQSYIEVQFLKMLFRAGKVNNHVLDEAKQTYAWNVGRYETHSKQLTPGEMESISRMFKSIIMRNNEFNTRYKNLGAR